MGAQLVNNSDQIPSFCSILGWSHALPHLTLEVKPCGSNNHVRFSDEKFEPQSPVGFMDGHGAGWGQSMDWDLAVLGLEYLGKASEAILDPEPTKFPVTGIFW